MISSNCQILRLFCKLLKLSKIKLAKPVLSCLLIILISNKATFIDQLTWVLRFMEKSHTTLNWRISKSGYLRRHAWLTQSLPNQKYHHFHFTVTSQNVASASATWMAHYPFHPVSTLGSQHLWPALSLVICPDISCFQTVSPWLTHMLGYHLLCFAGPHGLWPLSCQIHVCCHHLLPW